MISCAHAWLIQALVGSGADLDSRDGAGQTALHISANGNHNRLSAYLLRAGVDMEVKDLSDMTPTELVSTKGDAWRKTLRALTDPTSLFWNKSHHATAHYKAGRYEEACTYYAAALELVPETRPRPSGNNQATLRYYKHTSYSHTAMPKIVTINITIIIINRNRNHNHEHNRKHNHKYVRKHNHNQCGIYDSTSTLTYMIFGVV